MSARSLKVDTHTAGRWLKRKLFPGLRIRGQWLGKAGFRRERASVCASLVRANC
jgi:hypothetical protein